nr:translation initiation factor IF-2 [Oryctolagus cuniculus]
MSVLVRENTRHVPQAQPHFPHSTARSPGPRTPASRAPCEAEPGPSPAAVLDLVPGPRESQGPLRPGPPQQPSNGGKATWAEATPLVCHPRRPRPAAPQRRGPSGGRGRAHRPHRDALSPAFTLEDVGGLEPLKPLLGTPAQGRSRREPTPRRAQERRRLGGMALRNSVSGGQSAVPASELTLRGRKTRERRAQLPGKSEAPTVEEHLPAFFILLIDIVLFPGPYKGKMDQNKISKSQEDMRSLRGPALKSKHQEVTIKKQNNIMRTIHNL